jgi:hypothetical protein
MWNVIVIFSVLVLTACSQATPPVKTPAGTPAEIKTGDTAAMPLSDETGLERFLGAWQSGDNVFGQAADSSMRWAPALEGKFIRLDYVINPAGGEFDKSIFSGVGYYKIGNGPELKAFWADTSGDLHPITATLEGDALVSVWGVEGEKLGKTRYSLNADGTIGVTDWIWRDGEFKQFNQNTFSRAPAD